MCGPWGVPACGVVPERCHAVGAAVDAHRDTPAWVQRAERTVEGGVVAVPRARSVSPRAPCMTAPRVARLHPLFYPQLLATKAMTSRHTGGLRVGKQTILVSSIAPELRLEKLCKKF